MKKSSVILIILAGVFWGSSAIFTNLLRPHGFSALQMTAMRSVIAAVFMCVYLLVKDKSLFRIRLQHLFLFILGGITTFCASFFYYESMNAASVPVAVMLMYTAPVFVIIYSAAFLGEKISLVKFISITAMLFGCAFVSGIFGGVNYSLWGIISGLLSGISYASYNIITKMQMNKYCRPESSSLYCFLTMAVIAFIFADIPGVVKISSSNPVDIYPLVIGIGVCTMALPYFLYTIALKYVPAGTASALGIVEPVMATVFAVVFFGDKLDIFGVFGIILVIASVLALGRNKE